MELTSESVVVDASIVVKWYLAGEVLSDNANAIYSDFSHGTFDLVAPDHIKSEVASAITWASRGQGARLSRGEGRTIVAEFLELGLPTIHPSELILSAYELVHDYGVSIYDALYLSLAAELNAQVITADAKFYRRVSSLPEVMWLGDYHA